MSEPEPLGFDPDFAAECEIRHALIVALQNGKETVTVNTEALATAVNSWNGRNHDDR